MTKLFLIDIATGRLHVTKAGRELWAKRLAAAGVSIDCLHSRDAFSRAIDQMFEHEFRQQATLCRGHDQALDAIMDGVPGWDS
ncbi:hypothetical protein [Acidihalobacter ferrooxydans]|uniref:Uncharacterized protein n=1 Tax=Acidihalobacter ferrooxydans TaxID=1765967 RepID=A0A1P8UFJ9_9GAMM|nr:hypothetical protein [Acidihalobacter ferrooxydans]APZ42610.1 hypothetical protein BW247_05455 [Acidihalobacter ferrooxydans]